MIFFCTCYGGLSFSVNDGDGIRVCYMEDIEGN